jgi:hypothetical protein
MISSVGLNSSGSDAWLVTVNELAGRPNPLEPVTATSPRDVEDPRWRPPWPLTELAVTWLILQRGSDDKHHEPRGA